jgi:hypothetical protein
MRLRDPIKSVGKCPLDESGKHPVNKQGEGIATG